MFKRNYNTYYKVQYFDSVSKAWVDIQRAFNSKAEAVKTVKPGKQARLMEITGKKRIPITI